MARILIVDDSAYARNTLRSILEEGGHSVFEAASGMEAIETCPIIKPELITLDLLMPGLSGEETLAHLKKVAPQAKILVITADVQKLTRQAVLEAGADGFLEKPYQKDVILAAVEGLLA